MAEIDLIGKVRKALGRTQPLANVPPPPVIDDSLARLVRTDADLQARFIKSATEAHFEIEQVSRESAGVKLADFLRANNCKRIGLAATPLLEELKLLQYLRDNNFDAASWKELTSDQTYDLDCGVTDVHAAVAETGSLVIRPEPNHGRLLSLVPPIHVAFVEPKKIVADLIDLMNQLGRAPNTTLITGPSKTADIEGALVTGVHGPGLVRVMLLNV